MTNKILSDGGGGAYYCVTTERAFERSQKDAEYRKVQEEIMSKGEVSVMERLFWQYALFNGTVS